MWAAVASSKGAGSDGGSGAVSVAVSVAAPLSVRRGQNPKLPEQTDAPSLDSPARQHFAYRDYLIIIFRRGCLLDPQRRAFGCRRRSHSCFVTNSIAAHPQATTLGLRRNHNDGQERRAISPVQHQ